MFLQRSDVLFLVFDLIVKCLNPGQPLVSKYPMVGTDNLSNAYPLPREMGGLRIDRTIKLTHTQIGWQQFLEEMSSFSVSWENRVKFTSFLGSDMICPSNETHFPVPSRLLEVSETELSLLIHFCFLEVLMRCRYSSSLYKCCYAI